MIRFEDITHQVVWMRREAIAAILIPSPLVAGGDGQCRVIGGGVASIVTRDEAERLVALLKDGAQ